MTAREAVARYYDAWKTRRGDFTDVPLARDFGSRSPSRAGTLLP